MSVEDIGEESIRVVVSKDHSTAEMLIPADYPRATLTEQTCLSLLQQSGVEITEPVTQAIREMLATSTPPGQEQHTVLAHADPAVHGENAYIEWLVTEPNQASGDEQGEGDGEEQSHYDRSAYIVVKPGDVVGRVVEATDGADGRDVLGQTIAAIPGRPVPLKLDETITRDGSGQLIAQVDGILHRETGEACVRQMIEVPGYVDFSTGNIDFIGDVLVKEGVRDCFIVKATGSVEVRGLIEAATIECGGDLTAQGGMAGRERGQATVGGNLVAKYLDNIQAEIQGDVEIQREMINCDLTVHGSICSPRGTIIGGRTTVVGEVEVVSLGSGAGVSTEMVLGTVPKLEPLVEQLTSLIEQFEVQRDEAEAAQKLMRKGTRISNADKERQTELMFEHQTAIKKISEGTTAKDALTMRIKERQTVALLVHRKLFAGSIVTVGNQSFKVLNDVRGPVKVYLDPGNREVSYRMGESAAGELMTRIAELKAAAAA